MSAGTAAPSALPTAVQRIACRSMGTKQCAAICLSHSCLIPLGDCPEVARVWTDKAIARERARRTGFDAFLADIEAISGGVGRSEQSHAWEMYREGVSVEMAAAKLAFHRGGVE